MALLFLALCIALSQAAQLQADSWGPPQEQVVLSSDGTARLTVTPRPLVSALAYFDDKAANREPAGAPPRSTTAKAIAKMEGKTAAGQWQPIWTRSLDNEVSPVEVVVARNGSGFATFDNWHSTGYGDNAIAIYDRHGKLVRRIALTDIFPDWYVAALPHSVSSINWRGMPRISADSRLLIVPAIIPGRENLYSYGLPSRTVDVVISMADGVLVNQYGPSLKAALNEAKSVARESCETEMQNVQRWNAPISAPQTGKEKDWYDYLRETQLRANPSDDAPVAATTVLRRSSASDFEASLEWLEDALMNPAESDDDLRVIGSPDLVRMTSEIERIGSLLRQGQLANVLLVVVANPSLESRIRKALVRSGAELTVIDPAARIPQARQRLESAANFTVCNAPAPSIGNALLWGPVGLVSIIGGMLVLLWFRMRPAQGGKRNFDVT